MKIQDLAIISVIIIIPISLVLSVYTQYQIQTLNTQTLYDAKLTTATFDAIKAFQINTTNSTMSDLSNSKLRDIEASVSTFKNSIMSTFGFKGYKQEDMNNFIPALVYTMYDGFYIYSPYENTNYLYEYARDAAGNIITDASGKPTYEYEKDEAGNTKYDASGNPIKKSLDNNGETLYGLKPYITYSCRYQKNDIDVIITYSLDNYITVQGKIGGNYVNEEGYLIDGITDIVYEPDGTTVKLLKYNGVEIESEVLQEFVDGTVYPYIKINGTKYYYDNKNTLTDVNDDEIFYISNGKRAVQGEKRGDKASQYFNDVISKNKSAVQYYYDASVFTNWVRTNLGELTYGDSYDLVYSEATNEWNWEKIQTENQTTEWANKKIFDNNVNIENDLSNFNLHRLEVIRYKIESNLSIAISNYNRYSLATGIEFQLPKLKEEEWDLLINNISLISFVQGLDIGGKVYNGYTIVTNSETKEVVQEENIYILGTDNYYHRIGDKDLENSDNIRGDDITAKSAGRLNLDFKKQKILSADGTTTRYYYPLRNYLGSYNSIVTQNEVTAFDDIYAYIQKQKDNGNIKLAKAFYTALGRERYGMYKALRTNMLYTDIQ